MKIVKTNIPAIALGFGIVLFMPGEASASDWFIGATIGKYKNDLSIQHSGLNREVNDLEGHKMADQINSGVLPAIRVGQYLSDQVRVYATLNYSDEKDSNYKSDTLENGRSNNHLEGQIKNTELSVSADYLMPLFNLSSTNAYVEATVGLNHIEYEYSNTYELVNKSLQHGSKESDTSWLYGVQAGVIHQFTQQFSAELGMRYLVMNNKFTADEIGEPHEVKLKNQIAGFVGINYSF